MRDHDVPDHGPSILAVSIVLVSLSGFAVGTRLVRRLCMVGGGMGVDDWLISFALVSVSIRLGPRGWSLGHNSLGLLLIKGLVLHAMVSI